MDIGMDTPQSLLRAVLFLNGKKFCLRGGVEHRELRLSVCILLRDTFYRMCTRIRPKK